MKHFRFRRTSTRDSGWGLHLSWLSDDDCRLVEIRFPGIQYPLRYLRRPRIELFNSPGPAASGPYTTSTAAVFTNDRARLERVEQRVSVFTNREPPWNDRDSVLLYPDGPDLLPLFRICQTTWKDGGPGEPLVDWLYDLSIPLIAATLDFRGAPAE
jgi:hypothetical protein